MQPCVPFSRHGNQRVFDSKHSGPGEVKSIGMSEASAESRSRGFENLKPSIVILMMEKSSSSVFAPWTCRAKRKFRPVPLHFLKPGGSEIRRRFQYGYIRSGNFENTVTFPSTGIAYKTRAWPLKRPRQKTDSFCGIVPWVRNARRQCIERNSLSE